MEETEGTRCSWYVDLYTLDGEHRGNEVCGVYSPDDSWQEHQLHHVAIRIVSDFVSNRTHR